MCRSLPEIEESLKEMYQISVISLFFVSLLGLIVSYVTAKYVAVAADADEPCGKGYCKWEF